MANTIYYSITQGKLYSVKQEYVTFMQLILFYGVVHHIINLYAATDNVATSCTAHSAVPSHTWQ